MPTYSATHPGAPTILRVVFDPAPTPVLLRNGGGPGARKRQHWWTTRSCGDRCLVPRPNSSRASSEIVWLRPGRDGHGSSQTFHVMGLGQRYSTCIQYTHIDVACIDCGVDVTCLFSVLISATEARRSKQACCQTFLHAIACPAQIVGNYWGFCFSVTGLADWGFGPPQPLLPCVPTCLPL